MSDKPAILGNTPVFRERLPIVQPTLPPFEAIASQVEEILSTGMLTKGKYLRLFEERLAEYLGVRHAVCVSSCTLGLALTYQGLELKGEVIVPSFTFMATVHPLVWVGVEPVFVDIDPHTWNIDPAKVEEAITPRTSGIVAVHNFGNPADVEILEDIARRHGLRLVFDAAHGFGALYQGKPVGGYGDAEVFSLSPTKLLVAGEGGVVATNDDALAEHIRIAREYGNDGRYGSNFPGLNARMPEFNAILGLKSLEMLEENAERRNQVVKRIRERLERLPGLNFQAIRPGNRCSYKDLSVLVDESKFGLTRDQLAQALDAENIETRKYHDPPVHTHNTYRHLRERHVGRLPVTEWVAPRSLSLPIYSHMDEAIADGICYAIERIYAHADAVRAALVAHQ
ncbi:MAG: DegT/DnrJ/EryC1/StrS family aminotransferase [Anaerolineae bacterium]|uniref:DegT/DnrJ/EryC1/StrS family aminotransferase n=1 Tax=Thermanaerothrix sp. TaxID=2972675 RepID=UPI003C7983FA